MSSPSYRRPPFQLEMLEARMLLAGDIAAIDASGPYVTSFDLAAPTAEFSIASAHGGELTIDASLLPGVTKGIKISGFDTVTILGEGYFEGLDLSHIGEFSGSGVHITSDLTVSNVASIELYSIAGVAWLFGSETRLEVDDSRSATIVSDLDHLTISSKNDLNLLSTNPDQKIEVEFKSVRPSLMFPADNVTFTDIAAPTTVQPDDEAGSYNVIIISLSTANMTDALKVALTRGDADAVKNAFAELKSVQLAEFAYSMTFGSGNQAEINLADLQLTVAENLLDADATRVVNPILSQLPSIDILNGSKMYTVDESQALPHSVNNDVGGSRVFDPTVHPLDVLEFGSAVDAGRQEFENHQRRGENSLSLESIRSSLSGMVIGGSRFSTVSAYIISDVGTKLEPGELPGLLVDARSSRGRRDAVEWISV